MGNIKISSEINATIDTFTSQMSEMKTLFSDIKSETKNVKEFWLGEDSDIAMSSIETFMKVFDEIEAQNQKYSLFLEKTLSDYKEADDNISKAVDSE